MVGTDNKAIEIDDHVGEDLCPSFAGGGEPMQRFGPTNPRVDLV